jgi:GT2 family glycosyltransferase
MSASLAASVVVLTANRTSMLETCLDSLLAQTFAEPWEIVVVDDGLPENTRPVADAAVRRAPDQVQIAYYHQGGRGINPGRNRGAAGSRGELICLVDDDVATPPGWLAAVIEGARANPQADVLGGPIRLRIEGREPRHCRADRLPETQLDRGSDPVWDEKLWGANLSFRRDAYERFGPFREDVVGHGDEEEWEDRILAAGGHTLYLPDAWLWHRRTQAELGHRYLIRRSYWAGYSQVPYRLQFGHRVTFGSELMRCLRGLGHAAVFGCFYGLLRAVRHFGALRRLWELRGAPPRWSQGEAPSASSSDAAS